ncbi:MAG TPA: DUF1501 domain-containing protein [Tepidisphaeraceae bacterium]|jgi:uncharacterized protein (DUF1501 family)|nr:DUF1501 domain-containing protein [Tepidisphaeraceae bacterium]
MFNPSDIVYSRRLFLTRGVQLLSIAGALPAFLDHSATCMAADFAANPAGAGRPDANVLVVLQLAGGNDGLNTVVPLNNDDYNRARPTLGVRSGSALKLTDQFGVHPSCTGFKKMYDNGDLAIVHATGYPNANRSHFTSTDIWTTGEPGKKGTSGWLGRYCDACCSGSDPGHPAAKAETDPATAIAMDSEPPAALNGEKYVPLTFQAGGGQGGRGNRGGGGGFGGGAGMSRDLVSRLNGTDAAMEGHAPAGGAAQTEAFLQQTALNARLYADKIRNISSTIANKATYPQSNLARDLKLVAQLIASGMPTRVYYVKLGGFDTHAEQLQRHPRLLEELSAGVAAFMDDLKQLGHENRVTLMTFSEFGRRVHENGSGTDHGEAAPMFIAGGAVKAGFHGTFPSMAADKLHRGDIPFTTDFRRVYATLLHNWLGADDAKILGGKFEAMDFLKKA